MNEEERREDRKEGRKEGRGGGERGVWGNASVSRVQKLRCDLGAKDMVFEVWVDLRASLVLLCFKKQGLERWLRG